ncbi:MAG: phosphoribosyltransferase [Nitrososphaeraceae archaeon]
MQPAKFQSRIDAGRKIAERLFGLKLDLFGESGSQDIIILAVPRGGIIIGDIVASELAARLDVVVSRKVGAPNNPELAIGAVMPDGSYFLNQEIVDMLNVSQEYIDIQASKKITEIDRRLLSYGGSKEYDNEFEDKIIVLVDDGIATDATIIASANWIKNKQRCKKLLIAVPVAPSILKNLNQVADDVIVLYTPEDFMAAGAFYQDFAQIGDDEVKEIMKRHGYNI